jgi:hypothetical protein
MLISGRSSEPAGRGVPRFAYFKCPRSCNHSITIFSTRTARGRISALATLSNARKTGRENRIDVGGGFVIFFIVSIPVVCRTLQDYAR